MNWIVVFNVQTTTNVPVVLPPNKGGNKRIITNWTVDYKGLIVCYFGKSIKSQFLRGGYTGYLVVDPIVQVLGLGGWFLGRIGCAFDFGQHIITDIKNIDIIVIVQCSKVSMMHVTQQSTDILGCCGVLGCGFLVVGVKVINGLEDVDGGGRVVVVCRVGVNEAICNLNWFIANDEMRDCGGIHDVLRQLCVPSTQQKSAEHVLRPTLARSVSGLGFHCRVRNASWRIVVQGTLVKVLIDCCRR